MHTQRHRESTSSAEVLTKAALRASQRLALHHESLALILGVSAASLSRLSHGRFIRPETKEGELAVLFVRLFRSLDALFGGDEQASRKWLHAYNEHLGGVPAELILTVQGLVGVVEYLQCFVPTITCQTD